jgi:hypothetical protein
MIRQSDPKNARIVSVIAATVIALACGTNVSGPLRALSALLTTRPVCLLGMGTPIRAEAQVVLHPEQSHRKIKTTEAEAGYNG